MDAETVGLIGAASTVGVAALTWLATRARGSAAIERARIEADSAKVAAESAAEVARVNAAAISMAPAFARITALEKRDDERTKLVNDLRADVERCEQAREECRAEVLALKTEVGALRSHTQRLERDLTSRIRREVKRANTPVPGRDDPDGV